MPSALEGADASRPSPIRAQPVTSSESLRVLVVDGEPLIRWSLARALEARGHRVVAVADTTAAFQALATVPPDAVVLDCQYADSEDLMLLEIVHRLAPDLPVIGMTAFPSGRLRRRAGELGAVWILEKPFDVFSVEGVLVHACARKVRNAR
jgi:DNA-binding NtrC family response regulator